MGILKRRTTREKFIDFVSQYKTEYLVNQIISFLKRGLEFSHDDVVSILDSLFNLMLIIEQKTVNNLQTNISDYRINELVNDIIGFSQYKPFDNQLIIHATDDVILESEWHVNQRYYNNRRKVSCEYYYIAKEVLYEHRSAIEEHLEINLDEYYRVLESITKNAFDINIDISYIEYGKIIQTKSTERILELLQRKNGTSGVKIFNYNNYLFSTDFFYFEENSFAIIEELLLENGGTSIYNKLCKSKGRYLEKIVYDKFKDMVPSYLNARINEHEIDILSVLENDIIVHVETKAIKYDSHMKEQIERWNNCKNYLKQGLKQLYVRDRALYDGKVQVTTGTKEIISSETSIGSVPILITIDDTFDLSQLSLIETQQKGFIGFTPLILNLDDFFFIIERCESFKEFAYFALQREMQKMKGDNFYKDDLIYFLLFKGMINIHDYSHIKSSCIRKELFFRINQERFSLKDNQFVSLSLSRL